MKYIKSLYTAIVVLLLTACQSEQWEGLEGGFIISLGEDVIVSTKSTPAELGKPDPELFKLKIVKESNGNTLYDGNFTGKTIPASAGLYTLTATCGENPVLALDAPYYKGEESGVEVTEGETTSVELKCSVANALTSVIYDEPEKFNDLYSSYGLKIAVSNLSVTIGPSQTYKSAYYQAGTIPVFQFVGTLKDNGQEVSTTLDDERLKDAATFAAGKHCKLTLKVKPTESGVILTVGKVEVETVSISETIPVEWLPKPKIDGFENGQTSLTYTETADPISAQLSFSGSSAIQDVEFSFNFQDTQEKFQALNNRIFLLSQLSEEESSLLNAASIILPSLNGTNNGFFDFTAMTGSLQTLTGGTDAVNAINLRVKANNRWSNEEPTTYQIVTTKPIFHVSVYPGNIWTKEFTMNALTEEEVESGDYSKLSSDMTYQFSNDGNNWTNLGEDLRKAELTPGTTYYIRGVYRGEIASEQVEVKTYETLNIPNSSLDEGYSTTYPKNENPLYTFNGGWIGTRNPLTCHTEGVNAFYVSKSSTLPVSDNGSTVAHMMTIGWGAGNTCAFGKKSGSVINNISAGLVCVGDYSAEGDKIAPKEAYTRPTALSFIYKASPYNGDEYQITASLLNVSEEGIETEIGRGELLSGESISSYTTREITITYNDANKKLPITHIRAIFKAGTKEDKDHLEDNFRDASIWDGYTNAYIVGSQFWLDSFTFKFDK